MFRFTRFQIQLKSNNRVFVVVFRFRPTYDTQTSHWPEFDTSYCELYFFFGFTIVVFSYLCDNGKSTVIVRTYTVLNALTYALTFPFYSQTNVCIESNNQIHKKLPKNEVKTNGKNVRVQYDGCVLCRQSILFDFIFNLHFVLKSIYNSS